MDVGSVGSSAMTPDVQSQYAVKLIKMIQQSEQVAGSILEDTAEISKEAMDKFLSEVKTDYYMIT